jgi:hypothetical protein|tara:strand:- start:437 stop:1063 length:627 start_codon:yes stop_codon:yes gene_type:complete
MRINDLTQFQIEAVENRENFLSKFREKGISNAEKLKEIKTKLYLGDFRGRKVNFYVTFSPNNIECKSNIDLETIGRNFGELTTYQNGRIKSFIGNYPTTRKGGSNITQITLAYLMAFSHICTYKKVGYVNDRPSKELVRELMYLTMPEAETSEDSKMYGVTWYTVIKAWNLEPSEDYHLYKRYFNGCVDTDLKNMKEVKNPKENRRAS